MPREKYRVLQNIRELLRPVWNEERKAVRRKRHLGLTLKEIGMVLQQEEIT